MIPSSHTHTHTHTHTHSYELPPISLKGVTSTSQNEMTEMGQVYKYVPKFQQKGVANIEGGDGEYEVIINADATQYDYISTVATTPTKSQDHITDSQSPPVSHPPSASQTEAERLNDGIECVKCVAYETTTPAPPSSSISNPQTDATS